MIVYCQIDKPIKKGDIIIGGTGSISHRAYKGTEFKLFNAYINPTFNYFFIDNLALGLTTVIGYTRQDDGKTFTYGIGPNIKYYFNNGFLLRSESLFSKSNGDVSTSNFLTFKSGIGYAIFINSKVSIEPSLLYYYDSKEIIIPEKDLGGGIIIPEIVSNGKQNIFILEIGFNVFL